MKPRGGNIDVKIHYKEVEESERNKASNNKFPPIFVSIRAVDTTKVEWTQSFCTLTT